MEAGGREGRGRVEYRGGGAEGRREGGEEETQRKNSYLPTAYGFGHLNPLAH